MLSCCCGTNLCSYIDDDFTRANETPLASPWTKLSGTAWNLTSNEIDAVAAADYRHDTAFPGSSSDSRSAVADFIIVGNGGFEVQTGKTDKDNYFAAALTYVDGGCSTLTAGYRLTGTGPFGCVAGPSITDCVQVWGLEIGMRVRIRVCLIPNTGSYGYSTYDKVIALITFPDDPTRLPISCTTLVDGPAVGAYSGLKVSAPGKWDNFKAQYYRDSPSGEHRTCPTCKTGCAISKDDFSYFETCLWDTRSGSYSVSGGKMLISADGSVIQHAIFHSGLRTTFKFTVDIIDDGIPHRFYHGNGYAVLDFSGSKHRLRLFDNDDNLLDTDDDDAVIATDGHSTLNVVMCYSRGVLSCTVGGVTDNGTVDLCVDAGIAETAFGYWASLGGDSGATFANFVMSKTYHVADSNGPVDNCDGCESCPIECTACFTGTISDVIVATIYDIAAGDGGDGPPPDDQCAWPMTGEDGSSINGTSWAALSGADNATTGCCQWVPAGPTDGDGTACRKWQSDFLIWDDCRHQSGGDPTNGTDPCGNTTGCGGLLPDDDVVAWQRTLRLSCIAICPDGTVTATVLVVSQRYFPNGIGFDCDSLVRQTVTYKVTLPGTAPYDCEGNFPLRLDFFGYDGTGLYCGTDATEGGGTDNGYYDFSNSYIILENL